MGHSTMKREEARTRATAGMGHESIAFSERSHTRGVVWFCLHQMSRNGKFTETESTLVVSRNCEKKMGVTRFLFGMTTYFR